MKEFSHTASVLPLPIIYNMEQSGCEGGVKFESQNIYFGRQDMLWYIQVLRVGDKFWQPTGLWVIDSTSFYWEGSISLLRMVKSLKEKFLIISKISHRIALHTTSQKKKQKKLLLLLSHFTLHVAVPQASIYWTNNSTKT